MRHLPDQRPDGETFCSPAELADLLGIPVATIYRWNRSGAGPVYLQLGKHIRYRSSDVAEWLAQQRSDRLISDAPIR